MVLDQNINSTSDAGSEKLIVVEHLEVTDSSIISINSATYKNLPISGIFRVWDVDTCFRIDKETGCHIVSVICRFGDDKDEDSTLEFVYRDMMVRDCESYDGEVISVIDIV